MEHFTSFVFIKEKQNNTKNNFNVMHISSPRHNHDKIKPVPRIPQVRVLVKDESFGDSFDHHLDRIDDQEHVPATEQKK